MERNGNGRLTRVEHKRLERQPEKSECYVALARDKRFITYRIGPANTRILHFPTFYKHRLLEMGTVLVLYLGVFETINVATSGLRKNLCLE